MLPIPSTIFILLVVPIFHSCSQIKVAPPSRERLKTIQEKLNQQTELRTENDEERAAFDFLKAIRRSNSNTCQDLVQLRKKKIFPLKKLLNIRIVKSCPKETSKEIIDEISIDQDDWEYPLYIETMYFYSKQSDDHKNLLKYGIEYLPKIKIHKDQVLELDYLKEVSLKLGHKVDEIWSLEEKIVPRRINDPTNEQLYEVAKSFEKIRDYPSARSFYEKMISSDDIEFDQKSKAIDRLILSYKLERDKSGNIDAYVQYTEHLYRMFQKNTSSNEILDKYFELKINLARAYWTEEESTKAKNILQKLLEKPTENSDLKAKINWLIGLIFAEKKNYTTASKYLSKASGFSIGDSELREQVFWDTIWNFYMQGSFKKVILSADNFIPKIESSSTKDKIKFWQAKAYRAINDHQTSSEIFNNLLKKNPYDYYGLISYKELNQTIPPLEKDPKTLVTEEVPLELQWLQALKLKDEKKLYLQKYLSENNLSNREKIEFYYLAEAYLEAFIVFSRLDEEEQNEIFRDSHYLLFPTPIVNEIEQIPSNLSVDPGLILSIVRQESSFDPLARSWADAFGLMQLLPSRAKVLSDRYKIPYKDFYDLYDPEINLVMGSALLYELKNTFDNKFIHYVAAYNAGGNPVRKWIRTRFVDSPFKDIEMIPYRETRKYVKLVLRNYIIYKRSLSEKEFPFPKLN
jgi:soluble lytic murein transglycosylase